MFPGLLLDLIPLTVAATVESADAGQVIAIPTEIVLAALGLLVALVVGRIVYVAVLDHDPAAGRRGARVGPDDAPGARHRRTFVAASHGNRDHARGSGLADRSALAVGTALIGLAIAGRTVIGIAGPAPTPVRFGGVYVRDALTAFLDLLLLVDRRC